MTENPQDPQTNPLFMPRQAPARPSAQPPAQPPLPEPPAKRTGKVRVGVLVTSAAVVAALVGGAGGAALVSATDGGSGTGTGTSAVGTTNGQTVSNESSDVSTVAEKVLPSVVQIEATTAEGNAIGSGVILSEDGKILTNAHVVNAANGDVTVTLSDGTKYQASVLGADEKADIAVLQTHGASGLTPATLGDSGSVKVGEEVVAIGSPAGLQNTVTSGIVSAVDRQLSDLGQQQQQQSPFGQQTLERASDSPSYTAIQTDASINHGNSGGPLVNAAGEVIGINSAMYSPSGSGSVGIGFAIPINDAKTIINNLESGA
ncbi:S1C family serine protease [Prauserella cavernicola]|uniref:Trypsin-like peptidase domain-containing protein n=1 Tax=Prauserella cavernicola TaxID=2800127 RepID=A0A934QSW5_9PSEU|nr:trypsin-like peptidase domain-containing protein [Prauserella cavernicola]MBK1786036.1 trypsin-like peptidase domain-containing protein [Prauserella cavernicola]